MTVAARNDGSACDDSGVVGASGDITQVAFKFIGKLPDGTCAQFTSAPQFSRGHVRIRWRGPNPSGLIRTVATSKAALASASYDGGSEAVILVTQPITVGAFVGATVTLHLGLDGDVARFNANCTNGGYVGAAFGAVNPSTVDVQ